MGLGLIMSEIVSFSECFLPSNMAGLGLEILIGAVSYLALVIIYSRFSSNETASLVVNIARFGVRKFIGGKI